MTPAEQAAREQDLHKVNALLGHWRGGINPCTCWRCQDVAAAIEQARREEREAMKPLLETCSAVIIDVGQDALEDPVGYNRRADDGFCRVSIGPVDRLRDQLAAIRASAQDQP